MTAHAAVPGTTLKPVQLAYHVPDPASAAERCARDFGWGPFYLMEHIPLEYSRYRGRDAVFDHTSAYGQAGDVMVELITQHNEGASALRDLYGPDESGLHHVACFVPDLDTVLRAHADRGVAIALEARTRGGVEFAMVDLSATLGHMVELYEAGPELARFYAHVRRAADGWNGERPLRRLRA